MEFSLKSNIGSDGSSHLAECSSKYFIKSGRLRPRPPSGWNVSQSRVWGFPGVHGVHAAQFSLPFSSLVLVCPPVQINPCSEESVHFLSSYTFPVQAAAYFPERLLLWHSRTPVIISRWKPRALPASVSLNITDTVIIISHKPSKSAPM